MRDNPVILHTKDLCVLPKQLLSTSWLKHTSSSGQAARIWNVTRMWEKTGQKRDWKLGKGGKSQILFTHIHVAYAHSSPWGSSVPARNHAPFPHHYFLLFFHSDQNKRPCCAGVWVTVTGEMIKLCVSCRLCYTAVCNIIKTTWKCVSVVFKMVLKGCFIPSAQSFCRYSAAAVSSIP